MTEIPGAAITWAERKGLAGPGGYNGKVGKITLFSYAWAGGEKPWQLWTHLPGYSKHWRRSTPEAAQALAERLLATWLAAIGAQLVPATVPDREETPSA